MSRGGFGRAPLGGRKEFHRSNDHRMPRGHTSRTPKPGTLAPGTGTGKHTREWRGQLVHATKTPPWVTRRNNRRRNKAARQARKVTRRNG